MKRKFIIYLLFCTIPLSINAQNYKLVWSDEFNENSLNKNWNVEVLDKLYNNELQCYTNRSSNVNIENGNLVITARRESLNGKSFTSGRINSSTKVNFKHGKLEARIKIPKLLCIHILLQILNKFGKIMVLISIRNRLVGLVRL